MEIPLGSERSMKMTGGGGGARAAEKGGGRSEKFSRSTIACNGCRARKQKCGGENGPSKGYNETLELRLHETESALLAVLDVVPESNTQLFDLDADVANSDVTPSAAEKKLRLDEWAKFPLRTREDVLRWRGEQICRHRPSREAKGPMDLTLDDSMERSFAGDMEVDTGKIDGFEDGVGKAGKDTIGSMPPMSTIQGEQFESYFPPSREIVHSSAPTIEPSRSGVGGGVLGLSKEFQDTFIW